jgi:hypothetical protein
MPDLTPTQRFVAHVFRNCSDSELCRVQFLQGKIILLTDSETSAQVWVTEQQRDEELARRAAAKGCCA